MYNLQFSLPVQKDLKKLPKEMQKRILKKLQFFALQKDVLVFSKPLVNLPPATHRFRVGDYRIAFYISEKEIYIERIGNRREVYK